MSRELDAQIAEKVFGLYVIAECDGFPGPFIASTPQGSGLFGRPKYIGSLPDYSTSYEAMRLVIEHLTTGEHCFVMEIQIGINWARVRITGVDYRGDMFQAETLPLAICRAALAAYTKER